MQKLHSPRSAMRPGDAPAARRHRHSRGFSLIELMVTIGVVTILGAVAFAGMRQNEFEGQYLRFVQDVRGAVVSARNHAIDEQTPVRVDVEDDEVIVTAWNEVTETWDLINRIVMTDQTDGLLITDDRVCIYGFGEGVQTPAQFAAIVPPTDCLSVTQRLRFEADGTFTDPNNAFVVQNSGVTLWIGDRSVSGEERRALIQIFPGGLIRVFDKVQWGP